jgi:hypothetical protein
MFMDVWNVDLGKGQNVRFPSRAAHQASILKIGDQETEQRGLAGFWHYHST